MVFIPAGKDTGADALATRAVRDICRREARDFYWACALLPPAKRDAAYAVYAFCRMIDQSIAADVVTGSGGCCSDDSADSRLGLLRGRVAEVYDGRLELPAPGSRSPQHHALHAFQRAVKRYQIPMQHFLDLPEGCRADSVVSRYATWTSLQKHCDQVVGSVVLALACVLGVTHSGAGAHAVALGRALRLTNILRDLRLERDRGRIYLPLEDLTAFRYSERDLAGGVVNDNFRRLMRFQIHRARALYREAAEGLCWLADAGGRLTVAAVVTARAGILDRIERHGYDVFNRRPSYPPSQIVRRLPEIWRLARRRHGQPMSRPFGASRRGVPSPAN